MRYSKLLISLLWLALALPAQAQLLTTGAGPGGTFTPGCSQASTFLARVSNFSEEDQTRYSEAICALVASGTFAKLDALYILAAPNQAASLLNLVSTSFSLTKTGTMTFGANAGWMGDATTGYLSTGFTPSTAGGNYTTGSASLGVSISNPRTAIANVDYVAIGTIKMDGSSNDYIVPINSGDSNKTDFYVTGATDLTDNTILTANGFWAASRSTTTVTAYHNGVSLSNGTVTQGGLADIPFLIGALNLPIGFGGPTSFSGDTIVAAFIGGAMTQTDITALNNALSTFPVTNAPVVAVNWGYIGNTFSYNFATQGLIGIDVNGTMNPSYSLFPSWWFGCAGNVVSCVGVRNSVGFSYNGSQVVAGNLTNSNRLGTAGDTTSAFTGTVVGTTLTVTNILYGPILIGQVVAGNAALSGQTIVSQISGSIGGIGLYQLSSPATITTPTKLLGNSSVGITFPPGGYYELAMTINPSLSNGSNGFPSFWMVDVAGLYASNFTAGYGELLEWVEWDIFEANNINDMNGNDWTNVNGGTGTGGWSNTNLGNLTQVHQSYPTITGTSVLHYYGMLWVPSTLNSGTGLIQFFLDRTHIASRDITYTSAGTPSPACSPTNPAGCLFKSESGNFNLLIDSGGGGGQAYPANLTSVNVWH